MESAGKMPQPSHDACQQVPGTSRTATTKDSSIGTQQRTFDDPKSITNHVPSDWIATSLAVYSSKAGLGTPREHALISRPALNGLPISEALNADIEALTMDRGHRTMRILRNGGKHAVIPLAPRTGRSIDLYIGERTTGPIFVGAKGGRMDR